VIDGESAAKETVAEATSVASVASERAWKDMRATKSNVCAAA
jgi:hypothetical protein